MKRALEYMDLKPGTPMDGVAVDRVFIGSCTNSRIEDLRAAAAVAKGRKAKIPAWVVAGSGLIKEQAEAEGLDKIFREAGFDWREPGCSMCIGVNGDTGMLRPAHRLDLQPQLRRPPGRRRAHPSREPGDGRGGGRHRPLHRRAQAAGLGAHTMDAFTTLKAVAVPLDQANIDTDQIIPARFLGKPRPARSTASSTTSGSTPTAGRARA